MTVLDALEVPNGAEINADVCVVGSGAAGITIARQLNDKNIDVLLLEAGALSRTACAELDTYDVEQAGLPWANPNPDRGRWYGGSTNLWYGRIALPDPIDFEKRPWVPNSGWPLRFAELTPWMQTAADILDVEHFDKMSIEHWYDHPTVTMFYADGRAELRSFLWARGLYMGPRYRKLMEQSRNVRLILNATATELKSQDSGTAVASLVAQAPSGGRFTVKATTYVLAAGGLENPRLLLASTGGCATGFGNGHDLVGRYYMEHPRGEGLAEVDLRGLSSAQLQRIILLGERVPTRFGKAQLRVTFPEKMQRDEQLLNNSLHAHLVSEFHESFGFRALHRLRQRWSGKALDAGSSITGDVVAGVKIVPSTVAHFGRSVVGRARPTKLLLVDQMEQEPDPSSRVTVDLRQRDRTSLPRLTVDWRVGESTYRSLRRMHVLVKDILCGVGITKFQSEVLDRPDEKPELWDMKHPMGTTRMADSPHEGVVDRHGRVHGVRNLYVTGSSVFPTGGHANPTLMIVALAARLADRLTRAKASDP